MLRVCREKLVGAVPQFPPQMEQSINDYEVEKINVAVSAYDRSRSIRNPHPVRNRSTHATGSLSIKLTTQKLNIQSFKQKNYKFHNQRPEYITHRWQAVNWDKVQRQFAAITS
jgi:hypothetical protein